MSSSTPCAACKIKGKECTEECIFAPYFPLDKQQSFEYVDNVFGTDNVARILSELHVTQREDIIESLVYQAEARVQDPVHGCVGRISAIEKRIDQLKIGIDKTKKELENYIGPQAVDALMAILKPPSSNLSPSPSPPLSSPPPPLMEEMMPQKEKVLALDDDDNYDDDVVDDDTDDDDDNDDGNDGHGMGYDVVAM